MQNHQRHGIASQGMAVQGIAKIFGSPIGDSGFTEALLSFTATQGSAMHGIALHGKARQRYSVRVNPLPKLF
jgi:hypothetical protein